MDQINGTDLCKWDVFIAYYGGKERGTQLQAELLYHRLNGYQFKNGHRLRVYQQTCCNRDGVFGRTPEIVRQSRVLLLVADKHIPVEPDGSLLQRNAQNELKNLYEEVFAFSQSPSFRSNFEGAVCCVILCDDMTEKAAERLSYIFAGRVCRRWRDEVPEDFKPLLRSLSGFLTGDERLLGDPDEGEDIKNNEFVTATRGKITIGQAAQSRLNRTLNGQCAPYECISRVDDLDRAQEGRSFVEFVSQRPSPFIPDPEVFGDCEKILAYLSSSNELTEEEAVFYQFIKDIQDGKKESRMVARVCHIDSITTYGRLCIQLQPIEYLWIMKMTLLDTPFKDETGVTTLRQKYANPMEEQEQFAVVDRLACHSGCGVFIITSDGYLVLQNRFGAEKNRVSFFPGKISYTVSGSYLMNGSSVFDYTNEKIERELGVLIQDLYLWEFGYEYDYLHYQFSFFSFCEETKEEFMRCTRPHNGQAKSFSFYDLRDAKQLASILQIERWESPAWAVLSDALGKSLFSKLLQSKCGIQFDRKTFKKYFNSNGV